MAKQNKVKPEVTKPVVEKKSLESDKTFVAPELTDGASDDLDESEVASKDLESKEAEDKEFTEDEAPKVAPKSTETKRVPKGAPTHINPVIKRG